MNASRMKNIIVLKDLPSNLVDEAIVILKSGKKVKEKKLIEGKNENNFSDIHGNSSEVAIKEAEFLVSDYIKRLEKPNEPTTTIRKMRLQYKKLQICSFLLGLVAVVRNYNINI